jgi:polar amino acid transport system permease protein
MSIASSSTIVDRPPPLARQWTTTRIIGVIAMGFWILVGIGLVAYLISAWNPEFFARWAPQYLKGLWITLYLTAISVFLGALLSIPVTYARMSSNRILSSIAYGYVYFFRGTPLLAQTFLIYYGAGSFRPFLESVGLWWFFREGIYCAIFAFAINTAAYQAEILRGAIQSVPKGQWEGAASLGLSTWDTMRKIIAPQALIVALRPYGNEIILMIKGSAIVALVTVLDLMGTTRLAYSRSFDFQTYIWAGMLYLTVVEVLRRVIDWVEVRITRHLIR